MPSISNESCTEVDPLRWTESAGGPLILLSSECVSAWQSVLTEYDRYGYDWPYPDEPSTSEQTDYNRTCAIESCIGLVNVCDGQGVILGDAPMSAAW